jgi:hypothetical protein
MTDQQLTALLRLKRYEKPPVGYFDRLLEDVHRRQRAELLQRPLWKIAVERVQVFFSEHSMGNVGYAGAMAAVLVMGLGTISLMTPGGMKDSRNLAAETSATTETRLALERENQPLASKQLPDRSDALVTLGSDPKPFLGSPRFPAAPALPSSQIYPPRHVSDLRPASYEPSPSFSF